MVNMLPKKGVGRVLKEREAAGEGGILGTWAKEERGRTRWGSVIATFTPLLL